MKKLFTFFLASVALFALKTSAQTNSCSADFTFTVSGLSVKFTPPVTTNLSFIRHYWVKVKWNFGDGTSSSELNPVHVFAAPGSYHVCLTVTNSLFCKKEICKTVEVRAPDFGCHDISTFNIVRSTVNCLEFKFIPSVQNANWKYEWSFGDGSLSSEVSPSHVYSRAGNYTVSLKVYRSSDCVSTFHKVAETGPCVNCNSVWVKYEYRRDASSDKISFHAISNEAIISQKWTITKLNLSSSTPVVVNDMNPIYHFSEPGVYRVCLKVITQNQCVKEFCDVIQINAPNTQCILPTYPNPAHNEINVSVHLEHPEIIRLYIFNSLNVLLKQKEQSGSTGKNIVTANIETLVRGWYTVKVIYGNKVCYSKFQKL